MDEFFPGQRWISDAELQIGLGTVTAVEQRTVTISYPAINEIRTYARHSAPLTRVTFSPGDIVLGIDGGTLIVESILEHENLLTYIGTDEDGGKAELHESQLSHFIQLNRPSERLLNVQIDPVKWFELRYQTLHQINLLARSELRGLTGCRTSPIPHQLYIAHEVANRYAPRVLLADEVGLGKTIEAGLILHHQLLTERSRRVLIVVPENLLHQWLVEMLRRFNLHFSIFDEERCQEAISSTDQSNPFQTEQLVLCHLEFLVEHPERFQQALVAEWDLLIVDEAHHLEWSQQKISTEYRMIEQLATRTKGILLLTATPEQLGIASHFARLRLLDPDRFNNFDTFLAEEKNFGPVASVVEHLLEGQTLSERDHQIRNATIQEGDNQYLLDNLKNADNSQQKSARIKLVEHLLDRHGTGRVLFRNTRAAIKGFPERIVTDYSLPLPEGYRDCMISLVTEKTSDISNLLAPELLYQSGIKPGQPHWTKFDPRIPWLTEKLDQLRPDKVLLITANARTVLDIAEALNSLAGIHAAVFHEHMSILERDRAAAYFSDQSSGTQIMICSEIGSEGRNFQFAHQLILFDLPLNPDLLEQRIGRLDRIGQTETIRIHVPWLKDSPQSVIYRWYQEGLGAFEHTCPAGHAVFEVVKPALTEALGQYIADHDQQIEDLIEATQTCHQKLKDALQQGRDRLLEYNSCRPHVANAIKELAIKQDKESTLPAYMDTVFDCYGIHSEVHSQNCLIIRPSEYMLNRFPVLTDEGMTITYDRDIALANEDIHFLTWDHPMVTGAMDMVQSSEMGNTAVVAAKYPGAKPGALLLECIFLLAPIANEALQASRYMPPAIIRVLVDEHGVDHESKFGFNKLSQCQVILDKEMAKKVVQIKAQTLRELISMSETAAQQKTPEILKSAHQQSTQTLTKEINRLQALSLVNPSIRPEEIDHLREQLNIISQLIDSSTLRLDSLRVIIVA